MKAMKVPLKYAQKATKLLIEGRNYDRRFLVKKTAKYLYIPVFKKTGVIISKIPEASFKDVQLEKKSISNSYKDILLKTLSTSELKKVPKAYDVIGDIIILEIPHDLVQQEKRIAKALLKTHKNIKTVLKKTGTHTGEFRIQSLEFLAGVNKRVTLHKENSVKLNLNVENVYFSPRLSTERKRIYLQVKPNENILVMFSGIGIYPIVIAKNTKAKKVIGVEKNPEAHKAALENKEINKISNVEFIHGDVRQAIPKQKFDRIIMPLPKGAQSFLKYAFLASKNHTIIHFYDFEQETEFNKAEEKVILACKKYNLNCRILKVVKCGQYSPGKYRLCVDFQIIL